MTDMILSNNSERLVSFQVPWKSDKRRKVNKPPEPIDVLPGGWKRVDADTFKLIDRVVKRAEDAGMVTVTAAQASEDEDQGSLDVSE